MKFLTVKIRNINTVGEIDLNLSSLPAVTAIAGRTRSAGASSNGAGKTTCPAEAITWCLYGEGLKEGRAASAIIRRGEKSCSVEVTLEVDGKPHTISRMRRAAGGTEVLVDGKKLSTNTGTQERIESLVGMSYDVFTKTVVFGGKLSAFCRLTPSKRIKMLEEILDLHKFEAPLARVSADLAEAQRAADGFELKRNDLQEKFNESRAEARKKFWGVARLKAEAAAKQAEAAEGVRRTRKALRKATAALEAVRGKAIDAAAAYKAKKAAWKSEINTERDKLEEVRESVQKIISHYDATQSQIAALRDELERFQTPKGASTCPTCGQPVKARNRKTFDTSNIEAKMKELVAQSEEAEAAMGKAKKLRTLQGGKVVEMEANEPEPPEAVTGAADLEDAVAEAKAEWLAAKHVRSEYEDVDFSEEIEDFHASLAKAEGDMQALIDLEDANANTARDVAALTYLKRAFSRDGVPSFLLDQIVPMLNVAVAPFAEMLTDNAYSITFESSSDGRTDLAINVANIDGGQCYEDLSKGEALRVDLCVLFAVREVMQARSGVKFEQLFIDEVADGMDADGTEHVVRLLRSKRLAEQVFLISHDPSIQEAADGVILLEKKNGVTRLVRAGKA